MTADHLDTALRRPSLGKRQLEHRLRRQGNGSVLRRHRDKQSQEDGAVVIAGAESGCVVARMRDLRMPLPMGMHAPAAVVRRAVIVRVRVDERSGEQRRLDGQ